MAAFGIPSAHMKTTPIERRAAGFGILEHVTDLGLEARIGIEAGEVVVDETDSTFATGEAVNVAARLQQAAAPGEILIGEVCQPPDRGTHRDGARRSARAARLSQPDCRVPRPIAAIDGPPQPSARHGAVHRPPVGARPSREHACAHAAGPAAAGLHDLRRTGSGEEPARIREFLAGVEGATILTGRALPYGEGIDVLAAGRRWSRPPRGITDDDPMETAKREADRVLRRRGDRRASRPRLRRDGSRRGRARSTGDRVGSARVRGRARQTCSR